MELQNQSLFCRSSSIGKKNWYRKKGYVCESEVSLSSIGGNAEQQSYYFWIIFESYFL